MLRKFLVPFAIAAAVVAGAQTPALANAFKVHGSATVGKGIILPNQTAIEQDAGMSLTVVPNGSGNGLKDLVAGNCDAAMISAPLQVEADLTNRKQPGSLDVAGLQEHRVGANTISFIVHPNAPVKNLTAEQLRDVFTGKITSWKDLGGPDQPILLAVEAPGNGTRAVVVSEFLGGTDIAGSARVMQALSQVALVVSQAPTAIGYANSSTISPSVAVVQGVDVAQPLSIVTKGAPSAEAEKLIAAVRKQAQK